MKFFIIRLLGIIFRMFLAGYLGFTAHRIYDMYQRSNIPTNDSLKESIEVIEKIYDVKVDYSIHFYYPNIRGEALAYCASYSGTPVYVAIKSTAWRWLDEESKFLTLVHEIGHCSMGLSHNNAKRPDGCPVYLMNEFIPPRSCIKKLGIVYYLGTIDSQRRN